MFAPKESSDSFVFLVEQWTGLHVDLSREFQILFPFLLMIGRTPPIMVRVVQF